MSSVLDHLSRDGDRLPQRLRQMTDVIAQQNASLMPLQAEHYDVLGGLSAVRTERDFVREKHDAAQAEIEKSRRGQFGRRRSVRPGGGRRRRARSSPTVLPP